MTKLAWTPWHEIVKLRPDLKSGELMKSLNHGRSWNAKIFIKSWRSRRLSCRKASFRRSAREKCDRNRALEDPDTLRLSHGVPQ